jgi:hypothetical protein
MPLQGSAKVRSLSIIDKIADEVGCEAAVIDAIITVEAVGRAYDPANRLVIRPETHKIKSCPYLTDAEKAKAVKLGFTKKVKWREYGHDALLAGDQRWGWLDTFSMAFGDEAAYWITSFGSPQIMGFNFRLCGYELPSQMVHAFADSEDNQLMGMAKFLKASGLAPACRQRQWKQIARFYNGKDYHKNAYDVKLAAAYERSSARKGSVLFDAHDADMLQYGDHGVPVKTLQQRLRALGFFVDDDGDFGIETRDAVMAFQRRHALAADGKVGPKTQKALDEAAPKEANGKPISAIIRDSGTAQASVGTIATGAGAAVVSMGSMVAGPVPAPMVPVAPGVSFDVVNNVLVQAERGVGVAQKALALGVDKILLAIAITGIVFGGITLYRRVLAQRFRKIG